MSGRGRVTGEHGGAPVQELTEGHPHLEGILGSQRALCPQGEEVLREPHDDTSGRGRGSGARARAPVQEHGELEPHLEGGGLESFLFTQEAEMG